MVFKEGGKLSDLPFKTPLTPFIQILGISGCALPIIVSCIEGDYREYVWFTLLIFAIIYAAYFITRKINKHTKLTISDDEILGINTSENS